MRQRLERNSSPKQRFKKNMARILWNSRSSAFSKDGLEHVKWLFKQFRPAWHDVIADDYPLFVKDNLYNWEVYSGAERWREKTADLDPEIANFYFWVNSEVLRVYLQEFHHMPQKQS